MLDQEPTMPGFFITLEGPDGAGKTTQWALLADFLAAAGYSVVRTREPGGPPQAEAIRALLANPSADWLPRTEVYLLEAARHEHVERCIRPALAAGQIVLCDRFTDSTLAYQGYGKGLDLAWLRAENEAATGGLQPDLTLLYDLAPEEALQRIAARQGLRLEITPEGRLLWSGRGSASSPTGSAAVERMEWEDLAFHRRVREGFRELHRQEPHRIYLLDATADITTLQEQTRRVVEDRMRDA
jgi:dTMP kinase